MLSILEAAAKMCRSCPDWRFVLKSFTSLGFIYEYVDAVGLDEGRAEEREGELRPEGVSTFGRFQGDEAF